MMRRIISPKRAAALLTVFALFILSINAIAMFKVCLFSPVKGKVVLKGQPVVGAVIERSYDWAWKNQKGRDETTTDQNGEFSLPAIYGTMVIGSVMPHEPMIEQTINIQYEAKTHEAWYFHKGEYTEHGELGGKPLDLLCDLGNEPQKKNQGRHRYFGVSELR